MRQFRELETLIWWSFHSSFSSYINDRWLITLAFVGWLRTACWCHRYDTPVEIPPRHRAFDACASARNAASGNIRSYMPRHVPHRWRVPFLLARRVFLPHHKPHAFIFYHRSRAGRGLPRLGDSRAHQRAKMLTPARDWYWATSVSRWVARNALMSRMIAYYFIFPFTLKGFSCA